MRYNKDMVAVKPLSKESPSEYSLRVGNGHVKNKSLTHRKTYGQYYTPLEVSHFMAGLANTEKSEVEIADLGAGSGVLGISVCEALAKKNPKLRKVDLTAYEIDNELIPVLRLALLYTKKWLAKKNIELVIYIVNKDFILENAHVLQDQQSLTPIDQNPIQLFDIIISNPPYFKLNKNDPRAIASLRVIHGQPNIYALFMAIATHLLAKNGELIFITPRSYAAGPYFRLFREHFFSHVEPSFIHLFGSRNKAFEKDDVLQENIILKANRKELHNTHPDRDHQV